MTKITGKDRLKAVRDVKDLAPNTARDIKGGKKTAAQAAYDKLLRDKDLTDGEYWNVS